MRQVMQLQQGGRQGMAGGLVVLRRVLLHFAQAGVLACQPHLNH